MYWALSDYWRGVEHSAERGPLPQTADLPPMEVTFTAEEQECLEALRRRLQSLAVDLELDINESRLHFARWLVQHGKLDEGL